MDHRPPEVIYAGSHCHCVRLPHPPDAAPVRYALVAHADGATLGELRWHVRWDRYVLMPAHGTAWTSATLSEVSLWLRKLTRRALEARMRTTGNFGGITTPSDTKG